MKESDLTVSEPLLEELEQKLPELVRELQYRQKHSIIQQPDGREFSTVYFEDPEYPLSYLVESIRASSYTLFQSYLYWCRSVLESRGIPESVLEEQIEGIRELLAESFEQEKIEPVISILDRALRDFDKSGEPFDHYISEKRPWGAEARAYLDALLRRDRRKASEIVDRLVDDDVPIEEIYEHIFQASQYEVGVLWQENRISIGQEHFCSAATQQIMARLYPKIFSAERVGYRMVACTVSNELHELGIRMVADLFELNGWDTYYLGANLPHNEVLDAIITQRAHLLAISVALPSHLGKVKRLISHIRSHNLDPVPRIQVGGYPFTIDPGIWKSLGADASARTAREAIRVANAWMKGSAMES